METRSSSRFSGVFTLKTQAEANELAAAVTTLVERGVNIFQELEKGTSHEIEDTLKAVIRLSHSFKDLTLDEVENKLCAQVIEGMSAAEAGVQSEIRAYRSRPPSSGDNDARDKEIRNQLLAAHMQAFLSRLAELCDMMEDNQNKRGLMIIKQAILHLQFLRDPKNIQFDSKLKQFQGSANQVVNYVLNRENVAPVNSPLQTKLASLHKRLSVAVADVTSASTRRNNSFNNQQADSAEKAAVVALVHCLKEAGEIFAVNEARIKTSFNFTYEKLDQAMTSLSQAVQSGARAEATTQARVIVDALKQKEATHPKESAAIKKASVQLVEATKEALDDPNDQHVSELDKVMESVKQQFLELSSPATLRPKADGLKLDLLAASTNLSNCLSELTSPRSPRGDPTMRFISPRAPRNGLSLSTGSIKP